MFYLNVVCFCTVKLMRFSLNCIRYVIYYGRCGWSALAKNLILYYLLFQYIKVSRITFQSLNHEIYYFWTHKTSNMCKNRSI